VPFSPSFSASFRLSCKVRRTSSLANVAFDPRHVQADLFGDGKRARLVGLTAAGEQLLVELHIFFAGLVLHADGDGDAGGLDRARPNTGNSLSTTLSLGSLFISVNMSSMARLQ